MPDFRVGQSLQKPMIDDQFNTFLPQNRPLDFQKTQDYKQAFKYISLAANQNFPNAQSFLGGIYSSGRGIKKDLVLSYMWYNLASAHDDKYGLTKKDRDDVAKHMTSAQIAEAQKLAREWKPSGTQ
jgi:hypothetical protein